MRVLNFARILFREFLISQFFQFAKIATIKDVQKKRTNKVVKTARQFLFSPYNLLHRPNPTGHFFSVVFASVRFKFLLPFQEQTNWCQLMSWWARHKPGFYVLQSRTFFKWNAQTTPPPEIKDAKLHVFLFARLQHWFWGGREVSVPCYSVRDCRLLTKVVHFCVFPLPPLHLLWCSSFKIQIAKLFNKFRRTKLDQTSLAIAQREKLFHLVCSVFCSC